MSVSAVDAIRGTKARYGRIKVLIVDDSLVFRHSLANVYRAGVLSVVLTGMGSDGLHGTQALKAVGAYSLVPDEASSVVWGMPGGVANAGLADQVLPLSQIAPEIVRLVTGSSL
jgi:two-component system chemotaxis response regulator CheB